MHKAYEVANDRMSGESSHKKPPKKIKEIRTRKAKSGGYIHEHHHEEPSYHPMEEHTSPDSDAMLAHMQEHMGGPPNDGDADDAAGAGPAPGAAMSAAAPAPGPVQPTA